MILTVQKTEGIPKTALWAFGKSRTMKSRRGRMIGLFLIAWGICFSSLALAVIPEKITQSVHRAWLEQQGLPSNCVNVVRQTEDGFLWLGTQVGLVRFDGTVFRVFDKANTPALKSNLVQTLCEDHSGALWIGTYGGGVVCLSNGVFKEYGTESGLSDGTIWSIYEDRERRIWVGNGKGLQQFQAGRFVSFPSPTGESEPVWAIAQMPDGLLWVGMEKGLFKFQAGRFVPFEHMGALPNLFVICLLSDRKGHLWIGTRKGLHCFGPEGLSHFFPEQSIYSIVEDHQGSIWVATFGHGLKRITDKVVDSMSAREGLSSDHLFSVFEDREGAIWVGTYDGGLNCFSRSAFMTYTVFEGLSNNLAQPILETKDRSLLIGTSGGGIDVLRDGHLSNFNRRHGLPNDFIMALHEDSSGVLWVGTRKGLAKGRLGQFQAIQISRKLAEANVGVFAEDSSGSIWIGTQGSGLFRFKDGQLETFTVNQGLPSNTVFDLLFDRHGMLWIATNQGLTSYQDGRFRTFGLADGLSGNVISCISEDTSGRLLVGTYGNGLNVIENGKIQSLTSASGLFNEVVLGIFEAGDAYWFSSEKGVFRIGKDDFDRFVQGRSARVFPTSFGMADGMKSIACNGGMQPAGTKTQNGMLWIPTQKGIAGFQIDNFLPSSSSSRLFFENLKTDNANFELPTFSPRLEAGTNRVEIHYGALEFNQPGKVRFRYRLEGQDEEWVEVGNRRVAYYTNLRPGAYRFEIQSALEGLPWKENAAGLSFSIKPFFHQTPWFYALVFLLFAGILISAYWLRIRKLEADLALVLDERSRIAREIHDTLIQGITGVSLQIEAFSQKLPEDQRGKLEYILSRIDTSIGEARRAISGIRSEGLSPRQMEQDVRRALEAASFEQIPRISFQLVDLGKNYPSVVTDNLLRITQEAVLNAAKHAQASRIDVTLELVGTDIRLSVRDDGKGFASEDLENGKSGHWGLLGMRERARQCGGNLILKTSLEQGTQITVTVPR